MCWDADMTCCLCCCCCCCCCFCCSSAAWCSDSTTSIVSVISAGSSLFNSSIMASSSVALNIRSASTSVSPKLSSGLSKTQQTFSVEQTDLTTLLLRLRRSQTPYECRHTELLQWPPLMVDKRDRQTRSQRWGGLIKLLRLVIATGSL